MPPSKMRVPLRVKSNKQLVAKANEQLRAQTPKIARQRMYDAALELKRRMSKPGKKIKYPVNWDSEKQRLYVIIMLRKRGNLPYKRTGKHAKGWKIDKLKTGYAVQNTMKGSKYVYGDVTGAHQSRIHQGRWQRLRDQADIVIRKLPKAVQRSIVQLVKKVAPKSKAVT